MTRKITIKNRSFNLPILVASISSFETQLDPPDALRLQIAFREPISLISAYDVAQSPDNLARLSDEFRENGGVLLMDSGGYESSRIRKYADDVRDWGFEKYKAIASRDQYDFVFSFDYFLDFNETVEAFGHRLCSEMSSHAAFIEEGKLIPVVHLQSHDGSRRLTSDETLDLFTKVASGGSARFLAVPERELGEGIIDRARLAQRIVQTLRARRSDCFLHILGCGNLLSYSLFSLVGVVMCDGLEWCRTLAADNFHLHHFQHKDLFFGRDHDLADDIAGLPYRTAVAIYNLHHFQAFANQLQAQLDVGTVDELVSRYYGEIAGAAARSLVS